MSAELMMPTRRCPSITGSRRTCARSIVASVSCTESSAPIVTGLPSASSETSVRTTSLPRAIAFTTMSRSSASLQAIVVAADRQGSHAFLRHATCCSLQRVAGRHALGAAGHDVSCLHHWFRLHRRDIDSRGVARDLHELAPLPNAQTRIGEFARGPVMQPPWRARMPVDDAVADCRMASRNDHDLSLRRIRDEHR